MGIKLHNRQDISKRFAATMATMKKLDLFWRHSGCPTHVKVHVADAVLRSKLLYGLESAQLIPSVLKKLETFQLKVLRKKSQNRHYIHQQSEYQWRNLQLNQCHDGRRRKKGREEA